MTFDQEWDAVFTGSIAGFGGNNGSIAKAGAGTLTLTGTSSLNWSVDEGGLIVDADRFTGDAHVSRWGGLVFDQEGNSQYDAAISGAGNVAKSGAGTLLLT